MLLGGPRKEAAHVGAGSWRLRCFHMEDRLPRISLKAEAVELDRGAKREASPAARSDCHGHGIKRRQSGIGRWLRLWDDQECSREKCRVKALSRCWKGNRSGIPALTLCDLQP